MSLTAHCLVKNEEVFIEYTIRSVIDFVDSIMVYDTGSTDQTPRIVERLVKEYPNKISFAEKGACDKQRHTQLRQEMLERTNTDWFMVLDGDEVWTTRSLQEAHQLVRQPGVECVMTPFYLCVGDIYHTTFRKGEIEMLGRKDFFYPRFIKKINGVHWSGDYNQDTLLNKKNEVFFNQTNSRIMDNKYWHFTHLSRSHADDNDYSSGGTRVKKRIDTYFFIGRKINEPVPEVLAGVQKFYLSPVQSFINFFKLCLRRLKSF